MKKYWYFLAILFLWNAAGLSSKEAFYYTYQTKKNLIADEQRISVKLLPNVNADVVLSQFPFLDISSLQKRGRHLYVVSLLPGYSFSEKRQSLLSQSDIVSVQPVYLTRQEGAELYLTDRICVQFIQPPSISFLEELIERYGLQIVRKLEVEPYYVFRVHRGSDVL